MSQDTELANMEPSTVMHSIIQRIATGPELSKDISLEEARSGMRAILDGKIDPVQSAIFLIALRMKRETDDENKGVLSALNDVTHSVIADVDDVVDIADPYDGYNRTLPPSPFLPALLAACGVPAVSHGVERVGPKYGVTHHQVLREAGLETGLTTEQAARRIANPDIGWAYVDQKIFCPSLYSLMDLRRLIIKRPVITTVEVLIGPVRGLKKTHLITGYVHKPYPRIYAMLARHSGFDSALLIRGTEGGVIPSMRQTGKCFFYHDGGDEQSVDIEPGDCGIKQELRAVPFPDGLPQLGKQMDDIALKLNAKAVAEAVVEAGMKALQGERGATHDALVYSASLCLWHLKRFDSIESAADSVRQVLKSGKALTHFKA